MNILPFPSGRVGAPAPASAGCGGALANRSFDADTLRAGQLQR